MFTQQELSIIAGALNARINSGGLTVEEGSALSELADKVVSLQEADQDSDEYE